MKRASLYLLLVVLAVGVAACRPAVSDIRPTIAPELQSPPRVVGSASRISDIVEHAPDGEAFQPVQDQVVLQTNHRLSIKDGGEALLDFGDAMRVRLFNSSETTIDIEVAEPTPLIVHFLLARGGLLGQKSMDDERQVQIDTPSGAKITIIATTFFVTYDANTEITTVGNFDGVVTAVSAESRLIVPNGNYVVIGPGQPPGVPQPLSMDADDFIRLARELNSSLAVVDLLQADPTPTTLPSPTATNTAVATATPSPTRTLTPTPRIPVATFTISSNCRRGPGTIYEVLRYYNEGTRLPVTGRNRDASWWQLNAGNFSCWTWDAGLRVEHRDLVPIVPTPIPPTLTPTATNTPTLTPTPTRTPTRTPTLCPLPSVSVSAPSSTFVSWNTVGGCAPFAGTLRGRYSHEGTFFLTQSISQPSGTYSPSPPVICEGTFTIIYTVTLTDGSGRQTSNSANVQVTYIC